MIDDPFRSLRRSLLLVCALAPACVGGVPKDTTTTADTSTTTTIDVAPCVGTPLLASDGSDSGFVQCDDGSIQRAFAATCDPLVGVVPCSGATGTGTTTFSSSDCATDAECGTGEQCLLTNSGYFGEHCTCAAPCSTDSDCGAGGACVCGGTLRIEDAWATCVSAEGCKSATDCPSLECGVSQVTDDCGWTVGLACRTDEDACRSDEACGWPTGGATCNYVDDGTGNKTWDCREYPYGICGRPLLVEGRPQTAPRRARSDGLTRSDWSGGSSGPLATDDLVVPDDLETRRTLARHWSAIAAMEHASVASFARFTLQLVATGAPAELLARAQQAALDEIEHAKLAWGLAAAYGDESAGPGPMALSGLSLAADRLEILGGLIDEACVGETVSVAEALASAQCAVDPVVREVQARIAADEQRHAELAWSTLRWLLEGASEEERRWVADRFQKATDALLAVVDVDRPHRPEHGVIGGTELARVRRTALHTVVLPCAEALLTKQTVAGR